MLILIETQAGRSIYVHDIKEFFIRPEEFTDDSGYGKVNFWRLCAILHNGEHVSIFEANDFDNKADTFYYFDAVKGENYSKVMVKMTALSDVYKEVHQNIRVLKM